jgi:hypothetical protein
VAELTANRPLPAVRLPREELAKLWTELGAANAEVAYRALWRLSAGGSDVTTFLDEKLRSSSASEREVRRLIAELDADEFSVREAATRKLSDIGMRAQPLLQETWEHPPSAEVQQRVERLLAKLQGPGPGRAPERVHCLRAVQVLEYGGLPKARPILQALAEHEPASPYGVAARAALKRLSKKRR